MPFSVESHDNPETIRLKKYSGGTRVLSGVARAQTGRTPKEVVWRRGKARLYRYESTAEKRHPVPVLLVYALILRPYILDLIPGSSFVEYLLGEGFDVYMLDWGTPDRGDRDLSFEDYVLDYVPDAVGRVLDNSRAERLTLFGCCQGGTMSAMYAALFPDKPLKNLVLLATPIDFAPENPGSFGLWTLWSRNSEKYLNPDLVAEASGNLPAEPPGRLVDTATRMLEPFTGPIGARTTTRDRIMRDEPTNSFLAVGKWVDDGVPFPGEAFRQWIRGFYQRNRLAKGGLELRGRLIDLSNIECPVLNIAGKRDYICPLPQAEATMGLISSEDKEFLLLDAGHVGLMSSPMAKEELWPQVRDWLGPRSK